jgi:hypothetical protein
MMSIDDVLQSFLSKENLATAVGLRPPASAPGDLLTAFGLFGTGMLLGAGLALLFAPMAGREVREGIVEKVGELGDHFRVQPPQPAPPTNGAGA